MPARKDCIRRGVAVRQKEKRKEKGKKKEKKPGYQWKLIVIIIKGGKALRGVSRALLRGDRRVGRLKLKAKN
jgi:hypothetical protein